MHYLRFDTAARLGMTVAKLLTSRDAPLAQMELLLWATYHRAQERLRQQQQPRAAPRRG